MKKLLFYASAVAVLFSSCSKDATEGVATQEGTHKIFTASIDVDSQSTRLHLNEEAKYRWDVADGVGIASADNLDANIPAYNTVEEATEPTFYVSAEDYRYLFNDIDVTNKPLYVYYPYSTGRSFYKEDGYVVIDMVIPQVQRYNGSSFYKTTVRAVGYVEEYAADAHIEMTIPATVLNFNVVGLGNTDELSLQILDANGRPYALSGLAPVVVDGDKAPAINHDAISSYNTDNHVITVDFGSVAESFDFYESIPVSFVVPAGMDLSGATFVLANGEDTFEKKWKTAPAEDPEKYVTKANQYIDFTSFDVQFGLDNCIVIDGEDAALNFITYAYFAQPYDPATTVRGENGYPSTADYTALFAEIGNETLTADFLAQGGTVVNNYTALLLCDIDLDPEAFDAQAQYNNFGSIVNPTAMELTYRNALAWYINNECAIESLQFANVQGGYADSTNDKFVTINGLNVIGSGISAGAGLKNIKLTNSAVLVSTDNAGFLAADSDTARYIDNIVLGEGNSVHVSEASGYIGGILGRMFTGSSTVGKIDVVELPSVSTVLSSTANIGQIYGLLMAASNSVVDIEALKASSLIPVVGVVASVDGKQVVHFKNASADAAYEDLFVAQHATLPASIVINDTAYWNGTAVETNTDAYFTAEELAYLLSNDAQKTVAMTHSIDMQEIKLTVSGSAWSKISVINEESYEISNLAAKYAAGNGGYVALFGNDSTLENLELSNIVIDVDAAFDRMGANIAGLAMAGTAKNVVVDGLAINIPANTTGVENIGGVFATIDSDDINNVEVNNFNVNYAGEDNLGARVGVLAGTMEVATEPKGITLNPFTVGGTNSAVNVAVGQGPLKNATSGIDGYVSTKNYGTKYKSNAGEVYAIGTVEVTNAGFSSTIQKSYLNVADNWDVTKAFAAGIVFNAELTDVAAGLVNYDGGEHDYNFYTNAPIGSYNYKAWGFNPAPEM